ncbi:MAG: sugar transferase [Pirellulales bacterium]|nr:sugar transferase [Pirellulales bacterium]
METMLLPTFPTGVESLDGDNPLLVAAVVGTDSATSDALRRSARGAWPAARVRPGIRAARVSLFRQCLDRGEAALVPEGNPRPGYQSLKRAMDLVGALALLAVLGPVMLVVYIALFITTRGQPLFRQVRLGHLGRPFVMYKFRSMTLDAPARRGEVENEKDGPIFKNRRDPRVTRLGRFLRSTSLDETPQLFNVLAGHMSLVGPRPPLGDEVAQYQPWQRRRLAVKPGLTCLWQVSGRSEIDFEDWVRLDLWYVRHQSLATDVGLLLRTPLSVLARRGAY